ncbi:MAG: hypothetical protein RR386_02450 [Bacteroidaceae bacterium]
MNKWIINYGISIVMLLLMAGAAVLMETMELRTKVVVEILCVENGTYLAYIDRSTAPTFVKGDRLTTETQENQPLHFLVKQVQQEPSFVRLRLMPCNVTAVKQTMNGNSKQTSYYYTGRTKLRKLIFK